MTSIGFIGLGNMGAPMAGNLVAAGLDVTGHDVAERARTAARAKGLDIADSATEAAADRDIVITMLPDGAAPPRGLPHDRGRSACGHDPDGLFDGRHHLGTAGP